MKGLLEPIEIGSVHVEVPLSLGPMAGVTDQPFRLLCREQGAGLLCTEMVSAKAVLFHNKNTMELMRTAEDERPVALQLFGSDPETMAEAAAQIEELSFDIYDINMGCPVPKVVNNGEGSALMRDPRLAADIVRAMADRVKKPVTVKIRTGFNENEINAPELARMLEAAGAAALAVHGRTREQFYSGKADWSVIADVKASVQIPVFGNGDIRSGEDAGRMLEETGCDGVMIARAAQGNPWIFREVRDYLTKGVLTGRPDKEEIKAMMHRHVNMIVACKGTYTGVREMRKHVAWYSQGMPHSAAIRRRINEIEEVDQIHALIDEI